MIRLENLSLSQGGFQLQSLDLQVEAGEYAVLMGSTGCGKTTLLEAICGLRRVASGEIWLNQNRVTHWPPQRRNVGYVPQDAVLFPTMRVEQQIEFPLRIRSVPAEHRRQRVREMAELLEIENLLNRRPLGLSGGERQRVALARAIAFRPTILCLDEPLSALDAATHGRMIQWLRRIHQVQSLTVLHVTHNPSEARQLATRQFQVSEGRIWAQSTDCPLPTPAI